jgi:hypothetical protein
MSTIQMCAVRYVNLPEYKGCDVFLRFKDGIRGTTPIINEAFACTRDLWKGAKVLPEVFFEKDALEGVFKDVCKRNDVPYTSCRGYMSQSTMWEAGQRIFHKLFVPIEEGGPEKVVIFHFGDHDPSGVDMTRDIRDRLYGFLAYHLCAEEGMDPEDEDKAERKYALEHGMNLAEDRLEVIRVALTPEQIEQYNPPPNPTKKSDGRWKAYVKATGMNFSWELDALDPNTLVTLVEDSLAEIRDDDLWDKNVAQEEAEKGQLAAAAEQWDKIVKKMKL